MAGLAFGHEAANGEVVAQLGGMMGQDGAKAVEIMIRAASEPGKGTLATVVGMVLLIVGATTVFAELQDALDRIWRAPARPGGCGIWGVLRARLLCTAQPVCPSAHRWFRLTRQGHRYACLRPGDLDLKGSQPIG